MLSRNSATPRSGRPVPQRYAGKTFSEMMAVAAKVVVPQNQEQVVKELGKILGMKGLIEARMTMRDIEIAAINPALNAHSISHISPEAHLQDLAELVEIMREYCMFWDALFVHPVFDR